MRAFAFALATSLTCASPALAGEGLAGMAPTAAASRVASLNLCTDTMLLALADPGAIVSVTHLAQDRRETPRWQQARRYPANDGSILSIARFRPDLIVTMGGAGRDSVRLANAIGARFLDLTYPTQLDDMERNVTRLAQALGRERQGAILVDRIRWLRKTQPPHPLPAIFIDGSARSLSPDSAGAQWMRLAGYRQVALPGDRIDRETLLRLPPVTLLASDYRTDQYSRAHSQPFRRSQDRHLVVEGRRWTCMGPDLIPEIMRLRRLGRQAPPFQASAGR